MDYYIVNNIKYATTIPKEWATNHLPGTGPHECDLCIRDGFTKEENIWVNYCWFCAKHHYHGSRNVTPLRISNVHEKATTIANNTKKMIEELTEEDWAAIHLAYEMRNDNVTEVSYEYGSELNGGYDSH